MKKSITLISKVRQQVNSKINPFTGVQSAISSKLDLQREVRLQRVHFCLRST